MLKYFSVLIALSLSSFGFALEGKKLLEQIRKNYSELESIETGLEYKIYRGFDSGLPHESYQGYMCRDGENSFRKIHETDYINSNERGIHLQIDHKHKSISISNAIPEKIFDTDLNSSLKICGNIISEELDDFFIFSLYLTKNHDLPYSRIDLTVDKKFWIQKLTLYYAAKANFSTDFYKPDMDFVKMEISYKNFTPFWENDSSKTATEKYILSDGDNYVPTELYKNYSVVDLRK